jgi:hypothetical protein
MIDLGLSSTEFAAYREGLIHSHRMRVQLYLLDKDENFIANLSDTGARILDGSVQVSWDDEIHRQVSVSLFDPQKRLFLDPVAPTSTALFIDRFIHIIREDYIPSLARWVACPVFYGTISKIEEDGKMIEVEAMGKESRGLAPEIRWSNRTFDEGQRLTFVIEQLLEDRGETKMNIPSLPDRLKKNFTARAEDEPWVLVNKFADDLGRIAFYDATGFFQLRARHARPAHTFQVGVDVLSRPRQPFDFTEIRNIVQVTGEDDKTATERLDPTDQLSPESLSRNGKKRFMVETIDSSGTSDQGKLNSIAREELRERSRLRTDVQFDALPIPYLEEEDKIGLVSEVGYVEFRLKQFNIPLTSQGVMTLGGFRRAIVSRRASG